jgi:hypothetical protein
MTPSITYTWTLGGLGDVGHWHGRHTDRDRESEFYLTMLSIARIMSVERWWNDSDGKTEVLREPVLVQLCPP